MSCCWKRLLQVLVVQQMLKPAAGVKLRSNTPCSPIAAAAALTAACSSLSCQQCPGQTLFPNLERTLQSTTNKAGNSNTQWFGELGTSRNSDPQFTIQVLKM
jgi:hypothetical protein